MLSDVGLAARICTSPEWPRAAHHPCCRGCVRCGGRDAVHLPDGEIPDITLSWTPEQLRRLAVQEISTTARQLLALEGLITVLSTPEYAPLARRCVIIYETDNTGVLHDINKMGGATATFPIVKGIFMAAARLHSSVRCE